MIRNVCSTLVVSALAGCAIGGTGRILNTEPCVDARKDTQGHSVLLDTPRMWSEFRTTVDQQIAGEESGDRAPGVSSWQDHWKRVIRHMMGGSQDNAEKYVAYIVDSRRAVGLPELDDAL